MSSNYEKYLSFNWEHPSCIIFIQNGDFYETYGECAKLVSRKLNLILTSRDVGASERIPTVGFPVFIKEQYLQKLSLMKYTYIIVDENDNVIKSWVEV